MREENFVKSFSYLFIVFEAIFGETFILNSSVRTIYTCNLWS